MQQVSQAWKDAQEQTLVPESFVEISLNIGDPDSQADATSSSNGEMPFSDAASLVEETGKSPVRYAMLERNLWLLDGTFQILPDSAPYGENGYIGDILSGDDGSYDTSALPTITVSFSQVFTAIIPGITITWATAYNEWAASFRVTAFNGDTQVSQTTVTGNTSLTSVVNADIQNYNKITIEILSWCLPGRRARIEEILVGIERKYTKADLMFYGHSMFADPLSAELPKSEITFEIKNLNGEYNPDNPQGVEKYLMERQEITARYGYRLNDTVEWISAGTFFMSEWEAPQNGITASFTARDAIEFMSDLYTGPSSGTLSAIATAAFTQADLPTMPDGANRWTIDASLNGISAPSGVDLSQNSIAEVLQLCANAACCVFYQDRTGLLHIEPLAAWTTDYQINRFNSYQNSEISLTKQLKAVDVNNGAAIISVGSVGDTQQINNPLISASRAQTVGQWVADFLENRRLLSGNFRADPRLDALDRVTNINQFAQTVVLVTEISYTYNGAFRGSYEGRTGV